MRRDRLSSEKDARQILKTGQYGVLSTVSFDGTPYGVPLNYYYDEEENAVFFHCATRGQKLDNIAENSRVCFTVVTRADIDAPQLTTYDESAAVFGIASLVSSDSEKRDRLRALCRALTPSVSADSCSSLPHTSIVRISIESLSGKRNAPR